MKDHYERVATGVPGLDKLIEGGFLRNSTNIVLGSSGTGKTILALQYAIFGAMDYDEPSIYVSTEESPNILRLTMDRFGWPIKKLEASNMLEFYSLTVDHPDTFSSKIGEELDLIHEKVKTNGVKRIVIDSASSLLFWLPSKQMHKIVLSKLSRKLRKIGCTNLITSEVSPKQLVEGPAPEAAHLVDGVIALYYNKTKDIRQRSVEILKMRGTIHSNKEVPFKIEKGIKVYPELSIF